MISPPGGISEGVASVLNSPRIAVYTGEGSSHSWLWFVELFERLGFWDLEFPDAAAVREGLSESIDVLAVSGGDTFAIAGALGEQGASAVRRFVQGGGLYIGSCAGAYLPMPSSKEPLNLFNFVKVKIANLSSELLPDLRAKDKAYTAYGCRYVFHPVREGVRMRMDGDCLAFIPRVFDAPLYGGPAMLEGEDCKVIARYEGFSKRTVFLADKKTAARTLVGKAAIVRCPLGMGCFYLMGPHLEHPAYPEANRVVGGIIAEEKGGRGNPMPALERRAKSFRGLAADLRKELGNARIAACSLEFEPVRWIIGSKTYDPERIRVFIEAVWRRIPLLGEIEPQKDLKAQARDISLLLRGIKTAVSEARAADGLVAELLVNLKRFAASFFLLYFSSLRTGAGTAGREWPGEVMRRYAQ